MLSIRSTATRLTAVGLACTAMITTAGSGAQGSAAALSCPSRSNPVPAAGSVTNRSSIGVGVYHLADGNCTYGTHDAVLPPGRNTRDYFGWTEVAGAYVGGGYTGYASAGGSYFKIAPGPDFFPRPEGGSWQIYAE